jgi:hypothetical protein
MKGNEIHTQRLNLREKEKEWKQIRSEWGRRSVGEGNFVRLIVHILLLWGAVQVLVLGLLVYLESLELQAMRRRGGAGRFGEDAPAGL